MGIDFGVIWAADFYNVLRLYDRRPPSLQNSKDMTDIMLWVSILGLFWPLISIMSLDFSPPPRPPTKGPPPPAVTPKFKIDDRYIVIGVDFRVIWAADFNNVIRFYVRRRQKDTCRPPSHQN